MERDLGGGDLDVGGVRTNQHSVAGAYGRCSGYGHLYENPSSPCHGRIVDELILRRETKHPDIVGRDELTKAQTAESDIFENTQPRGVVLVVSPTHTAPVGLPSRLDETARFLESRIESYNVHAHSTRLLRCSEVNKGCYSEVI